MFGRAITIEPALSVRCPDLAAMLRDGAANDPRYTALRRRETIGRPVGNDAFLDRIEQTLDRTVRPAKRGPKTKEN